MAVGTFMDQVFTVGLDTIKTFSNLQGSAGSDWATHDVIGGKSKSQWVGPKLKSYTMDITLRAQDGVSPRKVLEQLQAAAESNRVDYFVVGGKPLSVNPFKLVSVSDSWDAVTNGGKLISCKVSLSIEEYA